MKKKCIMMSALCLVIVTLAFADDENAHKAQCYIKAYPNFFVAYQDGYLITKDNQKILFDDGMSKNYDLFITDKSVGDKAFDPKDDFHWDYPAGSAVPTAERPCAGIRHIRPESIFQYMYGSS